MDSLRKFLGLDRATRRTFSTGIAGVNLDKLRPGTFRLVSKLVEENRPPSIVNAFCHASASKTHSSIATTLKYYTSPTERDAEDVLGALAASGIGKPEPSQAHLGHIRKIGARDEDGKPRF